MVPSAGNRHSEKSNFLEGNEGVGWPEHCWITPTRVRLGGLGPAGPTSESVPGLDARAMDEQNLFARGYLALLDRVPLPARDMPPNAPINDGTCS